MFHAVSYLNFLESPPPAPVKTYLGVQTNFLQWTSRPIAARLGTGRQTPELRIMRRTLGTDVKRQGTMKAHRAVNIGRQAYEEMTIFFLDRPDAMPQPRAEPE